MAAVQVETDDEARELLAGLDADGRVFYLDVERKQKLDLMGVARSLALKATVMPIKPNDITVDAFQAVVGSKFGFDLTDLRIAIVGTGNLGFKFALRLAELGAEVSLHGRDVEKARRLVEMLNRIVPAYTRHVVSAGIKGPVDILASAVTAEHNIDIGWLPSLAPGALCVDVGINNLSPDFIVAAHRAGHTCMRLDVRSAGDPLPAISNTFFTDVLGRRLIDDVPVVAGGYIGYRGEVVLDEIAAPTRVVGVANGTGGLLPIEQWGPEATEAVGRVSRYIG